MEGIYLFIYLGGWVGGVFGVFFVGGGGCGGSCR